MEPLTENQEYEFNTSNTCHICTQPITENDIKATGLLSLWWQVQRKCS